MSDLPNSFQHHAAKIVGVILALVSIVSIVAMWFHPSVSSVDVYHQIQEINDEARINTFVHSILIAFIMLIGICLTFYAKQRGLNRSFVLFGIIIYWIATFSMVLAALLSGIVGPELATHYLHAAESEAEVFRGISLLKFEMNQAFANFAVYCWCVTMAFWALDMIANGNLMKAFGIVSLITAISIAVSLLVGWVSLSVFGITLILIIVSCWQLGIAYLLFFKSYLVTEILPNE